MSQQNIVKLSKSSHLELFWSLVSGATGVSIGIAIAFLLGWI
ncbi:MAG: hypothetical protein ACFCU5_15895 [Pleurocapsa sp.]